jgi:hypothetical protein
MDTQRKCVARSVVRYGEITTTPERAGAARWLPLQHTTVSTGRLLRVGALTTTFKMSLAECRRLDNAETYMKSVHHRCVAEPHRYISGRWELIKCARGMVAEAHCCTPDRHAPMPLIRVLMRRSSSLSSPGPALRLATKLLCVGTASIVSSTGPVAGRRMRIDWCPGVCPHVSISSSPGSSSVFPSTNWYLDAG